jgi:hypothetical protein
MKFFVQIVMGLIIALPLSQSTYSQNLLKERIWKISSKKRSIFFDKGVFHSPGGMANQKLKGIRNSYIPARKYERIVFDFTMSKPPKIYGHISSKDKKVYIDFFNTSIEKNMGSLKNIKYVKSVDFFNLDPNKLSVELSFIKGVSYDIFYLENPGRLVIDVKK